jgi:hypothetical protein
MKYLPTLLILTICSPSYAQQSTDGLDPQYLRAVISIENNAYGHIQPIGTGFVIQSPSGIGGLVTARHVIEGYLHTGGTGLCYRINIVGTNSVLLYDSEIPLSFGVWFLSSSADVAFRYFPYITTSDTIALNPNMYLSQQHVLAGAPAVVLGFPLGLRSEEYSSPILRKATIAHSAPGNIIIDAFVFPGNSGGPVVYTPAMKLKSSTPGLTVSIPYITEDKLIGIVSGYIPYTEPAVSPQTGRQRIVFEENTGLCRIVPIDELEALLYRHDVVNQATNLSTYLHH